MFHGSRLIHAQNKNKVSSFTLLFRQRPYHAEHTSSRPITEVKQHWAQSVLGWVTAWEHWVLLAFSLFMNFLSFWQTLCHLEFGSKPQTSAPKSGSFNHRWRCSSWALQDEVKDSFYSPTWCYNGNKTCFYAKKCTQNFEFRVFSRLEWTLECRWEIRFQQLWKIEFSESFWRNGR